MPIKPGRSRKDKADLLAALLTIAYTQQPPTRTSEQIAQLMEAWEKVQNTLETN